VDAEAQALRARFIAYYRDVAETRMANVPICNAALAVDAIGFAALPWGERLGVVVTPWFLNAMLCPAASAEPVVAGSQRRVRLPAGSFTFLAQEAAEIGGFWSCSLFSPMFEFADQTSVLAAAEAALAELLSAGEAPPADEVAMASAWVPAAPVAAEVPAEPEPAEDTLQRPSRRALLGLRSEAAPS